MKSTTEYCEQNLENEYVKGLTKTIVDHKFNGTKCIPYGDEVQKLKGKNRDQKPNIFFDEEPVGQPIKACISKQNPAWTKDCAACCSIIRSTTLVLTVLVTSNMYLLRLLG